MTFEGIHSFLAGEAWQPPQGYSRLITSRSFTVVTFARAQNKSPTFEITRAVLAQAPRSYHPASGPSANTSLSFYPGGEYVAALRIVPWCRNGSCPTDAAANVGSGLKVKQMQGSHGRDSARLHSMIVPACAKQPECGTGGVRRTNLRATRFTGRRPRLRGTSSCSEAVL